MHRIAGTLAFVVIIVVQAQCKTSPLDIGLPSTDEWAAFNPITSSCYPGNPFNSPDSCDAVAANWSLASFHAALPESCGSPLFVNNSCLPPGVVGYMENQGCDIGGMPQYVASDRNIRIVIKDTTGNVLITGSGNNYGRILGAAMNAGRVVISGNDPTVGPGGHIQGGGHGPLSSTYRLAADQIYQMRVVTTQGEIPVADATQNQDLLWAVRGGGAGQYGVVTESTKTYPARAAVITASVVLSLVGNGTAAFNASWNALGALASAIPGLIDAGVGAGTIQGIAAKGVSISMGFTVFNTTVEALRTIAAPVIALMQTQAPYDSAFRAFLTEPTDRITSPSNTAGLPSFMSTRPLGQEQISDLPIPVVRSYFERGTRKESGGIYVMVIGLQGGPGPRNVDPSMRGALLPSWRTTYLHTIGMASALYMTLSPQDTLNKAARWAEENFKAVWREWAPNTGSYMNEGNPMNSNFKKDSYGSSYDRLFEIKQKYDPTESLYVLSGVGVMLGSTTLTLTSCVGSGE
ncbi:hypothetical protein BGZ61DRAFT_501286 [Ilyonectria robusta]|uniref:uncharacterized protein n=1 Tax=Ilyonectria robusta TaxID=1079257 RepID=UPI001E8EBDE9|nr:uncharacterized protein BGZ61DRAFT_501286 [Ilyonectria robusta]KAH8647012.1 hypothetical protein BGZ61DRAFT_501286 [Ilyonectria robusta]